MSSVNVKKLCACEFSSAVAFRHGQDEQQSGSDGGEFHEDLPLLRAIGSWGLLGEGEPVFFRGVASWRRPCSSRDSSTPTWGGQLKTSMVD